MTLSERNQILLVEDDDRLARGMERLMLSEWQVKRCETAAEAISFVDSPEPIWAALVDVCLPDGTGFRVVERIRELRPSSPVLVMTGLLDHETISRAQILGAQYVVKPVTHDNVRAFLEWTQRWHHNPQQRLRGMVTRFAEEHRLSPREFEVLYLAATGVPPKEIHQQMYVSANTVKTLTRRTLHKCKARSLGDLVTPLQRAVLTDSVGATTFPVQGTP